jgi:hypothetical protein
MNVQSRVDRRDEISSQNPDDETGLGKCSCDRESRSLPKKAKQGVLVVVGKGHFTCWSDVNHQYRQNVEIYAKFKW